MNKKAVARFVVFVVIHVFLCVIALLYAVDHSREITQMASTDVEGIYIDGSDFTGIFRLLSVSVNGMISGLMAAIYFVLMLFFSVLFLVPFRFIALRKLSAVTLRERNATLVVILAGTALAVLAALIFGGGAAASAILLFMVPTLLIEVLMYWLTLFFRCRK